MFAYAPYEVWRTGGVFFAAAPDAETALDIVDKFNITGEVINVETGDLIGEFWNGVRYLE